MAEREGALRSKGYKRWHAFWCAVAGLILLCCINTNLMGRELTRGTIADGMRSSQLSDAGIPFNGTVTEMIRRDFVTDEQVTEADIADAVDTMGIPAFLAGKLGNYGALLSGGSDAPVHITSDEIVELLEDSEDALYDKCLLVIEDSDKAEIRSAADGPLGCLNKLSDFLYGSKFGRALAHFRISIWRLILDIVLMMLLVFRWAIVRENAGEDRPGAIRGMGITVIVPTAITLLCMIIGGVGSLFVKDGVIGLHPLTKALRAPLWGPIIFELACGILMTSIAKYLRSDARQRSLEARAARRQAAAQRTAGREARRQQASANRAAAQHRPAAPNASAAAPKRFCVSCGKELRPGAAFCIYCGTKLAPAAPAAPAPAAPVTPAPAAPVTPAPAAPAAPAPAAPETPAPAAPAPETDIPQNPDQQ